MEFCYIINYNLGKIFELEITNEDSDLETEELLCKHGFKQSDCYVMFTENKINIEPLTD